MPRLDKDLQEIYDALAEFNDERKRHSMLRDAVRELLKDGEFDIFLEPLVNKIETLVGVE